MIARAGRLKVYQRLAERTLDAPCEVPLMDSPGKSFADARIDGESVVIQPSNNEVTERRPGSARAQSGQGVRFAREASDETPQGDQTANMRPPPTLRSAHY